MRTMAPMQRHILFLFVLGFVSIPTGARPTPVFLALTVLGPDGQPVPKFEAMMHSHQNGYVSWQHGTDGEIDFWSEGFHTLNTDPDPYVQIIVRAPDLAPAILHLENTGTRMRETVKLTPGRLIELSVHTADGRPLPESITPLVVYHDFAWRVRAMRQPQNIRPGRVFDFEMSKVERIDPDRYQFRVPTDSPPFFLAIHEPGFMRSLESETFDANALKDKHIEWRLPEPARLKLQFDLSDVNDPPIYSRSQAQVISYAPKVARYYTVWMEEYEKSSFEASLADLTPGPHMVRVMLLPPGQEEADTPIFSDRVDVNLAPGEEKTLVFRYAPFEPNAWRGDATANITIRRFDGQPAADEPFTLHYMAPHYGTVSVLHGTLDAEGQFQLRGVATGPDGPEFFLEVGDRWGRGMQMTEAGDQAFSFTLGPQVGDLVPKAPLTDLTTNQPVSLDSFRGDVIYLEFWATWCGPCQQPMAELNELARQQAKAWAGRVHILAASIDDRPEIVRSYVEQRGWTHVRHLWAGDGEREFESKTVQMFGLRGVPTAMLIDAEGRIVWRGFPRDVDVKTQIRGLLQ